MKPGFATLTTVCLVFSNTPTGPITLSEAGSFDALIYAAAATRIFTSQKVLVVGRQPSAPEFLTLWSSDCTQGKDQCRIVPSLFNLLFLWLFFFSKFELTATQ